MRRVNVSGPVQSSASMVASAALGYSSNGPTRTRKVPSSSIDKFTTDPGRMPFDSAQAFGSETPRLEYPSFWTFRLSSSMEAICVCRGKQVLRMDDPYLLDIWPLPHGELRTKRNPDSGDRQEPSFSPG